MKLTYKEAYDKIIDAYFKDEIKPLNASFCFCGTICNNTNSWHQNSGVRHNNYGEYLGIDFVKMENALLVTMRNELGTQISNANKGSKKYEDALFTGMCAALDVLKQIHLERGEIIDEPIKFKKRELQSL